MADSVRKSSVPDCESELSRIQIIAIWGRKVLGSVFSENTVQHPKNVHPQNNIGSRWGFIPLVLTQVSAANLLPNIVLD